MSRASLPITFIVLGCTITACTGTLETAEVLGAGNGQSYALVSVTEAEYGLGECAPLAFSLTGPELSGEFEFSISVSDATAAAAQVNSPDEVLKVFADSDCTADQQIDRFALTASGSYQKEIYVQNLAPGRLTAQVQVSERAEQMLDTAVALPLSPGMPTTIEFVGGPGTLATGTCSSSAFAVQVKNAAGRVFNLEEDLELTLIPASASGTFHSSPTCSDTPFTTISIATGSSQIEFFYKDPVAASPTTLVASSSLGDDALITIHVSSLAPLSHSLASDRPLFVTKQILDQYFTPNVANYINDTNNDGVSDPDTSYGILTPNWDGNGNGTVAGYDDVPTLASATTLTNLTGLYAFGTAPTVDTTYLKSAPDNAGSLPTPHVASNTFTANLTASATFPAAVPTADQDCDLVPALSGTSCSLSTTFPITSSQLQSLSSSEAVTIATQGGLKTQAFASSGGEFDVLSSAPVPAHKYVLRQLANFVTGNDAVSQFIEFNGRLYFSAAVIAGGTTKLFSTDGTDLRQHTNLVSGCSDNPQKMAVANGRLFFDAATNCGGVTAVFSTNGTDLRQHSSSVTVLAMVANGRYFFYGLGGAGTFKLFSTNGSDLRQHANLNPGGFDNIGWLASSNNRLYFAGIVSSSNLKLFSTNGSDLRQHTNFIAGGNDAPLPLTTYNGRFFFKANVGSVGRTKLLSTDGADLRQHTNLVATGADLASSDTAVERNGRLYFTASRTTAGHTKLFSTDGTDLRLHTNLYPTFSDFVTIGPEVNGRTYFFAITSAATFKLYSTDGTDLRQHTNLNSGSDALAHLTAANGHLYFSANNAAGYRKLYSTDGTNLRQLTNLNASANDFSDPLIKVAGDRVYFNATIGGYQRLFSTDGTDLLQVSELVPSGHDIGVGFAHIRFNLLDYFVLQIPTGLGKLFRLCDASVAGCTEN